jgi:hypothetical protein
MAEGRPWYREPETFIALAALVVSLSAVAVGIYEAWLQRAHDRAEVWPHMEISTFTSPEGAAVYLENTGLGPAIINSMVVAVDGKTRKDWSDVMQAMLGGPPPRFSRTTVDDHALRAGDKVQLIQLASKDLPPNFWDWIKRIRIQVCYESAFHEQWVVTEDQLGVASVWTAVSECPRRPAGTEF